MTTLKLKYDKARAESSPMKHRFYRLFVKRGIDFVVALVLLVLLAPLLVLLAVLVGTLLGRPVLYTQTRIGRKNRQFRIVKFRTMTDARDSSGELLADVFRMTKFGRFLRSSSLDELPELWNVLRGEMSLVGPRPLLVEYLPLYTPEQARRHDILPGITGLAQVRGRNAISWEERFAYDVCYVDKISVGLDSQIFFQTLLAVIQQQGISAEGHSTMPPFTKTKTRKQPRDQAA